MLTGADSWSKKGVLTTKISVDKNGVSQDVIVSLAHLQAHEDTEAKAARASNIKQMLYSIKKADSTTSLPAILIGDLNIFGESEEYNSLVNSIGNYVGMVDGYRNVYSNATLNPGITYDAVNNPLIAHFAKKDLINKVQTRLDYSFTRGVKPTSFKIYETDISDHYGFLVDYDLGQHLSKPTEKLPAPFIGHEYNEGCIRDTDCGSGACARTRAGTDELQCCKTAEKGMYAGYEYCYNMPLESACWSDAMCASGTCSDNMGGLKKGKCSAPPTKKYNEVCSDDDQCLTGACARNQAGTDKLTCCKGSRKGLYAGYEYCYDMSSGNACWSDAMCETGLCSGNNGGFTKGKCSAPPTKKYNEVCSNDSQCLSGACSRTSAGTDTMRCCKTAATGLYAGYGYCYAMPRGTKCWSDAMCASDNCSGNWSGLRKGTCS